MAADVRRDVRHLYFVDIIVTLDRMPEPVPPVHRHFRHPLGVQVQKACIAADHLFESWGLPVLDDPLKAPVHAFRHRDLPGPRIGLRRLDDVFHRGCPLELMVNIDDPVLHVQVADRQPAELRDSHSCVEQDVDHFVILAVDVVVMHKLQELPHLVLCDGFSRHAVVNYNSRELKPEWILLQAIIIYRHLESGPEHAPNRLHTAAAPPITLQLDQEELCIGRFDSVSLHEVL